MLGNGQFGLKVQRGRSLAAAVFALHGAVSVTVLNQQCSLYLPAQFLAFGAKTDRTGSATLPLAIPQTASLIGTEVMAQVAIDDPKGAYGALSLSAGLQIVVGR